MNQVSVIERAATGGSELRTDFVMNGSFHLQSLFAAGDRLWALRTTRRDTTDAGLGGSHLGIVLVVAGTHFAASGLELWLGLTDSGRLSALLVE